MCNNRFYDFILRVCLLVHDQLLVDEAGGTRYQDFRDDEVQMWQVFEDFAYNFFRREQAAFRVARQPMARPSRVA